ncbi:MAG: MATE family efflux transporter [Blautia sp.]|nr:MATE family efflux transporter [Blautia sp.]MCM1199965.1 MATE family efflux transporter [Bacteroides fragilis]
MAVKVKNMTEGKPSSIILSFALSLMAGNIFQQLYTVVDTMVVGKALGVGALAALGAAEWMNWMMLGIIQGFTQGFGIRMAKEFGAGNHNALRKAAAGSAAIAAVSSVVLVITGQLMVKTLLQILQTPPDIWDGTILYLRIMFSGIPVVMLYNLLACILRALGDSRTPLNAMIVASVVNILLDMLFVIGFGWGIAGAASATLIAQMVSSIFCIWHIGKIELLRFRPEDFRVSARLMGELMYLGVPMAFQNAIIAVGGMIVQAVVNGFGVIFIAGFTATNKLYGLLEIAATSYGYAMVTYTGQNMGAGEIKRIHDGMRAAVVIAVLTSVVIAACMLGFGKVLLGLFISGSPETVDETLAIAYRYLAVMSVGLPILYILHVTRSAIQGMGNTVLPMLSGVAEFIMRTASALFLPGLLGGNGIFYAEIMAWMGADAILVTSYFIVVKRLSV